MVGTRHAASRARVLAAIFAQKQAQAIGAAARKVALSNQSAATASVLSSGAAADRSVTVAS